MSEKKTIVQPLMDGTPAARRRLKLLAGRGDGPVGVEDAVRSILADVRREGDRAVARYTERFDGVRMKPGRFDVGADEIRAAYDRVDRKTLAALRQAHRRIVRFHREQKERSFELRGDGVRVGMRVLPVERAGVYVPGGKAAYPSSVLMNVAPARVAGVGEIIVVTPPSPDGIRPEVLVAADVAGATRIVAVGGAQAVAALAYGTASIPRVDKIVGPGNIYVATAKRLVFGAVDIDMVAGPSEVLVVADSSANPEWVAADMLSQAEHDELAAAICLVTSKALAGRICRELTEQTARLSRAAIARESLARFGTVLVVPSLARAAELADEIAAEHLELFVRSPRALAKKIRNAGAIFLGQYTTEPLGDYAAGPNHVLPTGGAARFSSPLGVYDFVKRTSIIEVSRQGLEHLAPTVETLATAEGLEAHALAVSRRRRG
jgi:histidinol dehydrogenase